MKFQEKSTRPLSKLAYSEEVKEGSERKPGAYTLVREELSTEPTHKLPEEVESQNRSIRPLSKLAYSEEVKEGSERKSGVYTLVHEELSTEPTHKLPEEVEFRQRSSAIGIFGGTFDPIHLGHIHLANMVLEQCNLAHMIFLPCRQSSLKLEAPTKATHRLAMLQLATEFNPNFSINTLELDQVRPNCTAATLRQLRQKFPDAPLCWIMGIDSFNELTDWSRWEEIPAYAHIIVTDRPDFAINCPPAIHKLLEQRLVTDPSVLSHNKAGHILFININPLPIAASTIRWLIKTNQPAQQFLQPPVWQYIQANNLYK